MPKRRKSSLWISKPTVNNIVCTCYLSTTLYLPALIRVIFHAEFNAKKFAAITLRLHDPESTLLLFGSGNIVATGCKTVECARVVILQALSLIREVYPRARVYDFKVQNVVATCHFNALNLKNIQQYYGTEVNYEPELFPGAIFRPKDSDTNQVYLMYSSGKVVITGSKNRAHIDKAFQQICDIIKTSNKKPKYIVTSSSSSQGK